MQYEAVTGPIATEDIQHGTKHWITGGGVSRLHLIENAFLKLKQWRSIATRYAKTTASFLAECQIAAIMLWLR
jgi:transposase